MNKETLVIYGNEPFRRAALDAASEIAQETRDCIGVSTIGFAAPNCLMRLVFDEPKRLKDLKIGDRFRFVVDTKNKSLEGIVPIYRLICNRNQRQLLWEDRWEVITTSGLEGEQVEQIHV